MNSIIEAQQEYLLQNPLGWMNIEVTFKESAYPREFDPPVRLKDRIKNEMLVWDDKLKNEINQKNKYEFRTI